MGFFFTQSAADARAAKGKSAPKVIPIELLKQQGCHACPLDEVDKRRVSPKMVPKGPEDTDVYVLQGMPSVDEDARGLYLQGDAGELVYGAMPKDLRDHVRIGFAVRCRSLTTAVPAPREVACCSQHVDADVQRVKPLVVIGLGEAPLRWALGGATGALDSVWRGRFLPIRVGHHLCWYYHVQSPDFVIKQEQERKRETEFTRALRHDLRTVFDALPALRKRENPYVDAKDREPRRLEVIEGRGELDIESIEATLRDMLAEPTIGIDYETSALRPYNRDAFIATAAIATPTRAIAFPIDHPEGWPTDGHRSAIKSILARFILESGRKVAHNLGFEQEWTAVHLSPDLLRRTEWEDSMAAAHTLDERRGALSLGMTTMQRFGFDVKAMSNIDTKRLMQYPLADVLKYNALDAFWCLNSFLSLEPDLDANPAFRREYERKVRTAPTLALSQVRGVHCDLEYAVKMGETLQAEVVTAERLLSKAREVQEFERKFGRPFAVNDDDVVRLLRDVMHRNEGARGDGYSGDESVLSSLPASAGIAPQQILAVRGAQKLLGTYVLPLLNKDRSAGTVLRYDDGLIHTNYNLMLAITGRLSSDEPNLQNYPKRKRREVRGVIVAPAGHVFGACDYGQIEARVIAMASEDKALVDAMWTSYDIHKFWAERFVHHYAPIKDWIVSEFDVDWDEKGIKTLRQEAKNKWVFPMFFGSSHRSCAKGLHVPEDVAETIADEFWDTFSGVKKWQQRTVKAYEKNLYVETLTGRRRRGPTTLNELINTPIQGTAADIVLDAQNRLSEYADASMEQQFNPPINVHDDLSFYLPRATMVEDMERIAHTMCDSRFPFINVPIVVEASISQRHWHELTEIGVYRSDELGFHKR